jgi:mannose-6-phosphate isomerase-like protein (cupin superfamily)
MTSVRICFLAIVAFAIPATAQPTAGAADPTISLLSNSQIVAQTKALMDKARESPTGIASATLESYPGHSVVLVARARTGPSEVHANWNDVMFVLDGEATEVTGGTIIDGKPGAAAGEMTGAGIDGGTRTQIAKGDVVHIPPNTPHWAVLAPGKTLVTCIVKVAATPAK